MRTACLRADGLRTRSTGKGLRAERRAAALRFARNEGGERECARLGAEATDYGLRATRKPQSGLIPLGAAPLPRFDARL